MTGNPKHSPWYATPKEARKRPHFKLTLSPEYVERLTALAKRLKLSRSRTVEWLLDQFEKRSS